MRASAVFLVQLLGLAAAADQMPACSKKDMDVGGKQNSCDYMPVIMMVVAHGQEKFDWFEGHYEHVHPKDLDSAQKCQAYCEAVPHCKFWAYSPPDPNADCTLKGGYDSDACTPLYQDATGLVSGPKMCPSCIREEEDVGGGFNPCGYMDNVVVYAKPNATKPGWYTGHYVELPEVTTWTIDRCQGLCKAHPLCSYWHMSEQHCYLKSDYTDEQSKGKECVPLYQAFDQERDFKYASGPKTCAKVPHTTSCGEVKSMYKEAKCCKNPEHRVEM